MTDDLADWERDLLEEEAAERAEAATAAYLDALVLRSAARILRRRSKRPDSFMLGVVVKVLRSAADGLEEASHDLR